MRRPILNHWNIKKKLFSIHTKARISTNNRIWPQIALGKHHSISIRRTRGVICTDDNETNPSTPLRDGFVGEIPIFFFRQIWINLQIKSYRTPYLRWRPFFAGFTTTANISENFSHLCAARFRKLPHFREFDWVIGSISRTDKKIYSRFREFIPPLLFAPEYNNCAWLFELTIESVHLGDSILFSFCLITFVVKWRFVRPSANWDRDKMDETHAIPREHSEYTSSN